MGMKLRTFICIEKYGSKSIYKGQILEIMGTWFRMRGFMNSPINSYQTLNYGIHKWEEITNDSHKLNKIASRENSLFERVEYF